jgi:hypothetical protein
VRFWSVLHIIAGVALRGGKGGFAQSPTNLHELCLWLEESRKCASRESEAARDVLRLPPDRG